VIVRNNRVKNNEIVIKKNRWRFFSLPLNVGGKGFSEYLITITVRYFYTISDFRLYFSV